MPQGIQRFVTLATALFLVCVRMCSAELQVWSVDPLIKVFRDADPQPTVAAQCDSASGEHATFQLVVKSTVPLQSVKVAVSPFETASGVRLAASPKVRFVGYVHVDRPMQKPSSDQLRKPPADYPDILLEEEAVPVEANRAQPIWITVALPATAEGGQYHATAVIEGQHTTEVLRKEFPLTLTVYPIGVDRTRLWVTLWFSMHWPHMAIDPVPESEEYYALLRRYARNMAEHRQNVALISPLGLTHYGIDGQGNVTFDFSRFDRWVKLFQEEGVIGRIEGGHLGGRAGGWLSQFNVYIRRVVDGQIVAESVAPDSDHAHAFYSQFFPALVNHLKEQGWLACYSQHLADEPIATNVKSYRAIANLARTYAPELKTIDATHARELAGAIDVWVPQLNFYHNDYDYYKERQALGEEVWFYSCVFPQGEYANRFIELPLIKTRLLHWINFAYGATGYLHWGYNFWTADDPRQHTTPSHSGPPYLPAGDAWIVYPGKEGPLDSIRFEAMRDGITDHELLSRLAEKDWDKARTLVATHILDFDKYETNTEIFRETRRELLKALVQ